MQITIRTTSILFLLLIAMVSTGFAQIAPPSSGPVTKATTSPLTPMKLRQKVDASVDRNILLPSAETIGKGNFAFNSYQVAFAGFTYGMTESSQLSFSTLLPVYGEIPTVILLNAKIKVVETDRVILSVQPQGGLVHKSGGGDSASIGILGAGMAVDVRLDDEARAIFSGAFFANTLFASDSVTGSELGETGLASFTLTAGFNYRIGDFVKLMTELTLPAAYVWAGGRDTFEVIEQGLLLGYGVRFFGETLAFDLTFLRPVHPDVANDFTDIFPMGYPYIAFSAKF